MIRIKSTFWIIIGVLSVFLMLTLPLGLRNSLKLKTVSVFQPVLASGTTAINIVKNSAKTVFSFGNIVRENKLLKKQAADLEKAVLALQEASRENQRLRGLLSFKEQTEWTVIPARVIGRDSSVWFSSILIDKGKKSGIREGMPVISQAGVVGRVVSTGTGASQVMLITDINSRLSIIIPNSREEGVAVGTGANMLRIKYLSLASDLTPDNMTITSGLDRLYPKGLMLGKILRVEPEPDGVTRTALVRPSADLFKLEEVLCLDIENGL